MRSIYALSALLALAACGRPTSDDEAPQSDREEGEAREVSLRAGEWESRVEIVEVKPLPIETAEGSFTPELVSHSPPTTSRECMTKEQAAQPFRRFLVGGAASDCDSSALSIKDGRIGGTVVCTMMSEEATYRVDGRYAATSYDVTTKAEVRAKGEPMPMMPTTTPLDMTSRITGQRVGNCPNEKPQ